ncbi:unnamed protein product [Darwinula stevensoni]|uniref:Maspardin n=1 Tax=Darwinula stevensoni TaxID=69355 RepID=A0A7R8XCG2_9CRUS|nr:unnamed protein product [Darwinula stevensoni]CAG0893299.1 unnamed protein product [Darwinula stevensoni]
MNPSGFHSFLLLLFCLRSNAQENAVLETFDDVVDALTAGHHVQLVMDFRACGIEDELAELEFDQAVISMAMEPWQLFVDDGRIAFSSITLALDPIFVRSVGSLQSDSVFAYQLEEIAALDYSILYSGSFACAMNAGVTVYDLSGASADGRRQGSTLETYEELKMALLNGERVTRVAFYDLCQEPPPFRSTAGSPTRDFYVVDEGEASPPSSLVVHHPVPLWGFHNDSYFGAPFLGFAHRHYTEEGMLNFEEVEAYVDGWMKVIYHRRVMPDGVVVAEEFNCSIRDGVKFFAAHLDRTQLKSFQELYDAIHFGGRVTVASNFLECPGIEPALNVNGGMPVHNPYVITPKGGEDEIFFSAGGIIRNNLPIGGPYLYQNIPVVTFANGSAFVMPGAYVTETFENLVPPSSFYQCTVNDGVEGATYFYAGGGIIFGKSALSETVSTMVSAVLALLVFSGMMTFKGILAATQLGTILGGYVGSIFFILILTMGSELARSIEYQSFRASIPLKRIVVDTDGTNPWQVYDCGPKEVRCPLVCLPPVSGNPDVFFKQMLPLSAHGFRVIAAAWPPYWSINAWCLGFNKLLDHLDVDRVHIFGASLGGFLAQKYAEYVRQSRRIASLILCNAFIDTCVFRYRDISFLFRIMPNLLLKRLLLGNFPTSIQDKDISDSIDFVVEKLENLSQQELASRLTLNCSPNNVQVQHLQNLPITVIDVYDRSALTLSVMEEVNKCYPHAKEAHLKSGGNFPYLSRSEEVNLHIKVHLRQFESTSLQASCHGNQP